MKSGFLIPRLTGVFFLFLVLALGQWSEPAMSDSPSQFRARLSPMPVTIVTVRTITGAGEVQASLSGGTLTINGHFEGMSSGAVQAHLHRGAKARPGPAVGTLELAQAESTGTGSGRLTGTLELDDGLRDALLNEELYIQVHSRDNPEGELRGWLLPSD